MRCAHALGLLALALPAAASRHALSLDGSGPSIVAGERRLLLAPRLIVALRSAASGHAGRPRTLVPSRWKESSTPEGGEALSAELSDAAAGIRARLTIAGAKGEERPALLSVEVEHQRGAWSELVALEIDLPTGEASVLGRDLASAPARSTVYLDRGGAKEVRAGGVVVLVDDGVDGVVVRREHDHAVVRVELLSVAARPFKHDERCAQRWRSPNRKVVSGARWSTAGDRERAAIQIALSTGPTLAKARFPDGRRAALLITDHADQSTPLALAALANGRSDAPSPVGGLVGHHLSITKSLFYQGARDRPQLEDARVQRLAEELAASGSEVVLHSATPKPDKRAITAAALDGAARFHGATWIDHQPETNCEAFSNQGWRTGPFQIGDLLSQHHIRYVWSADDAPPGELDLLGPLRRRAPTVWPLGRLAEDASADGPWLFRTTWMFLERKRFLAALAAPKIDRLEKERGLAILHTYLETFHPKRTRFGMRNLLRADGDAVALDPGFDALLGALEQRVARGTLWVPTLEQLGDHARALEQVTIRYAGGAALVAGPAIAGLTLVVPGAPRDLTATVDEKAVPVAGGAFSFDLPADRAVRIELSAGGRPLPLLP